MTDFIWIDSNQDPVLVADAREIRTLKMRVAPERTTKVRFKETQALEQAIELLEGA